ncbi:MAG: hypothetical protein R6U63_13425, partial [Longimicrobiales bacterium]
NGYHSCAITDTGAGYCWGNNDGYQLGDGSNIASTSPVAVAGSHGWTDLAGSDGHTCGVTTAGDVYCWGFRNYGQTGTGEMAYFHTPITLMSTVSLPTSLYDGSGYTALESLWSPGTSNPTGPDDGADTDGGGRPESESPVQRQR